MDYTFLFAVLSLNLMGFMEDEQIEYTMHSKNINEDPTISQQAMYCLVNTYRHIDFQHLYWNMILFTYFSVILMNLGVSPMFIFLTGNLSSVIAFLIYTRNGDKVKGFSAVIYSTKATFVSVVFKSNPFNAIAVAVFWFVIELYDVKYGNKRTCHTVHFNGFALGLLQCSIYELLYAP